MPATIVSSRMASGVLAFVLLVSATAQATSQDPGPDTATLERRLAAAETAGDWTVALEAAIALAERAEERHVEALFHLARIRARLGQADQALDALEHLSRAGLFDVGRVRAEEAFAALREHPRFKAAAQAIWLRGYLWLLERPERDAYQQPARVIETLAFRPGERVADIGAGSGYFTRRIARAVGPSGIVSALDIRREILDELESRVAKEGLTNVRARVVTPDDPQLPAGGLDTIVMVDTLHYVKDRASYARKLRAGLHCGVKWNIGIAQFGAPVLGGKGGAEGAPGAQIVHGEQILAAHLRRIGNGAEQPFSSIHGGEVAIGVGVAKIAG